MWPKKPIANAKITPTFEYAQAPSFPPISPMKYPCHESQLAKVFVTNPQPTMAPTATNESERRFQAP